MIIKFDKGFGVVVMDKIEYIRLFNDVFINDIFKFIFVSTERLSTRGRFFKYYYLFL